MKLSLVYDKFTVSAIFKERLFCIYVGDIPGFGNNFATTLYGIVVIFGKALKLTGSIVDFCRSFKCCA